jgi:uncharacterized membrane protein
LYFLGIFAIIEGFIALFMTMKNFLIGITTLLALFFVVETSALAQRTVFDGGGADSGVEQLQDNLGGTGVIQSDDLIVVTLGWVRFALALLGLAAFIAFLAAGALYITAFANEENAETAKKIMIWTALGIIIILMSFTLVSVLIDAQV